LYLIEKRRISLEEQRLIINFPSQDGISCESFKNMMSGTLKKELERRNTAKIYLKHYHGDDLRGTQDYDYCLVSTPDLLAHAPNGRWLPNPIMIQAIESIPEKSPTSRIPKIAHYPYYKSYSAEDYFTNVLSILRDEDKIELVEIFDMPHLLALNKM
jgi:hypothetical protein